MCAPGIYLRIYDKMSMAEEIKNLSIVGLDFKSRRKRFESQLFNVLQGHFQRT